MSDANDPQDPWKGFPGGNPFGPNGPFGPGSPFGAGGPFGADPFKGMEHWLRGMGVDPDEFRNLVAEMQRGLENALRGMGQDPSRSFMHGFHVRVGPDGRPRFSSFGDKTAKPGQPGLPHETDREPLTDLIEEDGSVAVTMELPGVDKQDIDLRLTEDQLEVAVDTTARKYHKRVPMPAKVDPSTTRATFKNGILDVQVRKAKGTDQGLKINVD